MIIEKFKKYVGTPFSVGCKTIDNDPGTWSSTEISIFRDDLLIGRYIRNYFLNADETFSPFLVDDTWYALYCPNYIEVRVMKLHDTYIEDWCSAGPNENYTPVDFFIPRYNYFETKIDGQLMGYYLVNNEYETDTEFVESRDSCFVKEEYCKFAFVSGIDSDGNTQLKYVELQSVADKSIVVNDMGDWQLPVNIPLRKCIDMTQWEPGDPVIRLVKSQLMHFDVGS